MNKESKLRVIIVGSGIAGLTAARILREHHDVTVYERGDPGIATGGQGLMVTPNGVKILETIGYDRDRARAVPIYGYRMYDKDGNVQSDFELHLKAQFGADSLAQKRSDFWVELLRLATAPSTSLGIQGEPARVVYNAAVLGLDPEEGVVRFNDGSTETADVVIVADGVHSCLRNAILESDDYYPKETGLTCYRIAVTIEEARKSLGSLPLPHWCDPSTSQNRGGSIYAAGDGSFRMVTMYPICNQTAFNVSCIIRTQQSTKSTAESWYAEGDRAEMLEKFGDFPESFSKILSGASEFKIWELQDLDALPTWTRGRAILIGDAAHAMTPMQGQGANMGIEDAESLRLLAAGTRREDVPKILKLAESVRRPRAARVLEETRKSHTNLDLAEDYAETMQFNYGYKGIHEALEARQEEEST